MKKRIATLALALVMALALIPVTASAFNASGWAIPELEKAQSLGLIPDVLANADLTAPITCAEFAAVAVKTYENFTGATATPVSPNPFTDTSNTDVLKAFNINLVNGITATTYNPNGQLTRQDAATMMTRVAKKAYIPGWTLATDADYTLNFTQPVRFSDDSVINDYAKTSVYFMVAQGVINGTGNNKFSPSVTASRQEALIIAVRMVENTKGKTISFTQSGTPTPTPTPTPTQPPSGYNSLIGTWAMGNSTKQIRTILSGNYGDIKAFSFNGLGACYTFNSDGTYMHILASGSHSLASGNYDYMLLTVIEGRYSLSGGILTLTNRTGKKYEKTGISVLPITEWESVMVTQSIVHSIEFGVSLWDLDCFTLDSNDVKYEKQSS